MAYCKFKYGDKVTANGHKGKVVSITREMYHNTYSITVEFDDKELIPSRMNFGEVDLEYTPEDQPKQEVGAKSEGLKCNCGIFAVYGKMPAENHRPYCALRKKDKKEEIKVEPKDKPNKQQDDFLDEFERMLSGWGDDDDDDFGFYGI